MAALTLILAVLTGKDKRIQAWFIDLPIYWQIITAVTAFSVFMLLLIRALGGTDIFELIGI